MFQLIVTWASHLWWQNVVDHWLKPERNGAIGPSMYQIQKSRRIQKTRDVHVSVKVQKEPEDPMT